MYLMRVYKNYEKRAKTWTRKMTLKDSLQWLLQAMDNPDWTKMTLIDLKHRTVILIWQKGTDGRPQHPVLPGMRPE